MTADELLRAGVGDMSNEARLNWKRSVEAHLGGVAQAEINPSSDGAACGDFSQASQRLSGDLQPAPSEAAMLAALKDIRFIANGSGNSRTMIAKIFDIATRGSRGEYRDPAYAALTPDQIDKAALQLFTLDNPASRWPSVNQEQYRREAKSVLDAALSLPSTQNATPSGTGGPGPVVADQHAAANTPATSHSSTDRAAP